MTLRDWLATNHLEKYLSVLIEEEIDLDIVTKLDDGDLRELGLKLGARKRFIEAAKQLTGAVLEDRADVARLTPTPLSSPRVKRAGAERRNLTVMFCDMVGSTKLSGEMDPEDYREVVSTFQAQATETMREHEGFVARYMGDGILVYFGYPHAQENDAVRAVRAGITLVAAVEKLKVAVALSVRVGVATGSVVVGDNIGEGASEEAAVHGETPNLAARLQAVAEPGTVLINETTRARLGEEVETRTLTPMKLKGFRDPVPVYRALRVRSVGETSERHADAFPLVGRDVELSMIEREWATACSGEGRAVLLRGEAGVGKSRLMRAFRASLSPDAYIFNVWHCSLYHRNTASYPFMEGLRRRLGTETGGVTTAKLEDWLNSEELAVSRYGSALSTLFGLPSPEEMSLPPETVKNLTVEAQIELLKRQAEHRPVLFVVEDLHWCDGTTRDFLELLPEEIGNSRVLLLMTARPEFSFKRSRVSRASTYDLGSLNRVETDTLVRAIGFDQGLSEDAITAIVDRAAGLPLFAEALTQEFASGGTEVNVPASLQDALTARIDRLGEAKAVAQAAAVIGRDFTRGLLQAVSGLPDVATAAALDTLDAAGMIRGRRLAGEETYEFTHAMIRDVAYGMMLKQARREFHLRAARALSNSPESTIAEIVGHHLAEAEEYEEAEVAFGRAAGDARRRGAYLEAENHFRRAAGLVRGNDSVSAARRLQQTTAAAYMMHLNGNRVAANELLSQEESLASTVEDPRVRGWFHYTRGEVLSFLGQRESAQSALHQALDLARAGNDLQLAGAATNLLALEHFFLEEYREALGHAEGAVSILRSAGELNWEAVGSLSRAIRIWGMSACSLGEVDSAKAALSLISQLGLTRNAHAGDSPHVIQAYIGWTVGDWDSAIECIEHELNQKPSPFTEALLTCQLGLSYLGRGDLERAVMILEDSVEKTERYRSKQVQLWARRGLCEGYCETGRWEEAAELAEQNLDRAHNAGVPSIQDRLLLGRIKMHNRAFADAGQLLHGVLQSCSASGRRPLEASTHCIIASLASRTDDKEGTRFHLAAAQEIYRAIKAGGFVERTRRLAEDLEVI